NGGIVGAPRERLRCAGQQNEHQARESNATGASRRDCPEGPEDRQPNEPDTERPSQEKTDIRRSEPRRPTQSPHGAQAKTDEKVEERRLIVSRISIAPGVRDLRIRVEKVERGGFASEGRARPDSSDGRSAGPGLDASNDRTVKRLACEGFSERAVCKG